jgi:hypothetical protein
MLKNIVFKVKYRLLFCQLEDAQMFIKATMTRDKGNKNSELLFRQTQEVFGCLQLWVFNPKLDCLQLLSTIQCLECASITHLLFISRTIETDSGTQGSGPQKLASEPIRASLSASYCPYKTFVITKLGEFRFC